MVTVETKAAPSHDPFDLWALPALGRVKARWYAGSRLARLSLFALYGLDLAAPLLVRRCLGVERHEFAHTIAMRRALDGGPDDAAFVERMEAMGHGGGWGLPFAWFSRNGTYPAGLPLVTSTPYVLDALLRVDPASEAGERARGLFEGSWAFLESLHVHLDSEAELALSYAPFDDETTVVNANSYAAWAYAMHAVHGREDRRLEARARSLRLARWVTGRQNDDGSWYYLADRDRWDMIDGFHSCLVVRNLRSVRALLGPAAELVTPAVDAGWAYIRTRLFDEEAGLCRRYTLRSRPDPFRFDLYDQAEYLGLLIDLGHLEEARALVEVVRRRFRRGGAWYCKIDVLGRRWGRGFLRWGITPFEVHAARLEAAGR